MLISLATVQKQQLIGEPCHTRVPQIWQMRDEGLQRMSSMGIAATHFWQDGPAPSATRPIYHPSHYVRHTGGCLGVQTSPAHAASNSPEEYTAMWCQGGRQVRQLRSNWTSFWPCFGGHLGELIPQTMMASPPDTGHHVLCLVSILLVFWAELVTNCLVLPKHGQNHAGKRTNISQLLAAMAGLRGVSSTDLETVQLYQSSNFTAGIQKQFFSSLPNCISSLICGGDLSF